MMTLFSKVEKDPKKVIPKQKPNTKKASGVTAPYKFTTLKVLPHKLSPYVIVWC
jgi:hypothetical protein